MKYRHYLYALLIMLPTFVGFSAEFYLVFVGILIFLERDGIRLKINEFRTNYKDRKYYPIYLVGIILFVSLINKTFNGHVIISMRDYYASFYLLPALVICSLFLNNKNFFRGLIVLTLLEIVVAIAEFYVGNRSFLLDLGDLQYFDSYSLLYDSRVYGLGVNSSVLSYKILIAFFLVDYTSMRKSFEWGTRILLFIGLVITFGRTTILVLFFYWILKVIVSLISKNRKENIKSTHFQFSVATLILVLVFNSYVKDQLTRGSKIGESVGVAALEKQEEMPLIVNSIPMKAAEMDPKKQKLGDKIFTRLESVQTSGRKKIWLNYINYIDDHLWFGNGSDRLYIKIWLEDKVSIKSIHAHNSFIQLLASNGLLIFILYLVFYFIWMKSTNYTVILAILVYSLGNFGIFWGFSYLDIIFLIFLRFPLTIGDDY